ITEKNTSRQNSNLLKALSDRLRSKRIRSFVPKFRTTTLHLLPVCWAIKNHRVFLLFRSSPTKKFMVFWNSRASDRKSTRLNSSHVKISYAVFCLKKKKKDEKAISC